VRVLRDRDGVIDCRRGS